MVKKANDKWRMCTDYTDLNKACPKDEKMTFITEDVNFYYMVMPFSLKNASATYKRLMYRIFKQQIWRNVKVYVGDMVVKS